jgi:hypothetical protein
MKLRDINFNNLNASHLSIFVDGKEVAFGFIGEVLRQVTHLADYEIKDTNYFFEAFVIRL